MLGILRMAAVVMSLAFFAEAQAQTTDQIPDSPSADRALATGDAQSDGSIHKTEQAASGMYWDHNYIPAPPKDKAEVVFYRNDPLYGFSVDLKIMEGSALITTVEPNTSHYHIFDPGNHTFNALGVGIGWMKPGTPLSMKLAAGNIYLVEGVFYSNFWGPATPVLIKH